MAKKLTKEELVKFANSQRNLHDLKYKLAEITLTEESLKTDKQRTMANIQLAYSEVAEINGEINKKYGPGTVNMKTGEITTS